MAVIYIKAERNIEVSNPRVRLGDVLKIESQDPKLLEQIKKIPLMTFQNTDQKQESRAAISVLGVIKKIHGEIPDLEIQNVGEIDFIITYKKEKDAGKLMHLLKIVFVVLISFFGAAFSAMAFNNDVDMVTMFGQIYQLVTGRTSDGFTILEITYSIGLIVGILIFFNHFGKSKVFTMSVRKRDHGNPINHGNILKIVFVVLISFFGAAFSAMAFNNDVDTVTMFGQIYQLVTGRISDGFTILEITYSIGLIVGILIFFNHFGKSKVSVDPTPLEVEMRLYENDIQTTLIENYSRNSGNKEDSSNGKGSKG